MQIIIICREEWRSSQLIASKVVATDKMSVKDNISATDKMSETDKDLATNKDKLTATFAFRGFMGNYR